MLLRPVREPPADGGRTSSGPGATGAASIRSDPEYKRWIQQSLNQVLGTQLIVDGILGPQTVGAIRRFQQQRGLVVDGIVGPLTEQALVDAGAPPPAPIGEPRIDPHDKRVDLSARLGIQRMLKLMDRRADAIRLIDGINSGRLAGIFSSDSLTAFKLAQHHGTQPWLLVPQSEDAALVLYPAAPLTAFPTIVFRRAVLLETPERGRQRGHVMDIPPERLDAALAKASQTFELWASGDLSASACQSPGPNVHLAEAETGLLSGIPPSNLVPPIFCQRRSRRRPSLPVRGLDLIIDRPRAGEKLSIHAGNFPATGPSMPAVTVLGRVLANGHPVPDAGISWEFRVSGNYRVRSGVSDHCGSVPSCRLQTYAFTLGQIVTSSGKQDFVDLALLTPLIVGGSLEVKATIRDATGRTFTRTVRCLVAGENPSRAQVEALIRAEVGPGGALVGACGDDSWALIRIFCHESGHTLSQFRQDGSVLVGPPAGIGITQRDPEIGEWQFPASRETQANNFFPRIFWNWQENVREGIRAFRAKQALANGDLRRLQEQAQREGRQLPAFCVGILLRAAIRRYNGGTEYVLGRGRARNQASYEVNPHTPPDRAGYVNQVLGDHGHPAIALPAIPLAATHVLNQHFGAADHPCQQCNIS
ncbi:peptidoglycan-binding protein (plasmid) [Cupriavidus oxalaticus]|uniref:Peptidoglycan-binding protein n=2 Tax=Cupriavidus oxalaticus TaxID=96344 RepID=A0A4P7LK19_9BURK|nr:peptidoglycan-binding protein [Cupriavidus oxalaticus]